MSVVALGASTRSPGASGETIAAPQAMERDGSLPHRLGSGNRNRSADAKQRKQAAKTARRQEKKEKR